MKVRGQLVLGLSLALGASVPGCLAPTEVILEVSTNVLCSDLHDVAVAVGALSELASREISAQTDHCDAGQVGTLVLVPSGPKDQPVSFEVVAGVGRSAESCRASNYVGGCIVARRAFGFVAHRPLSLPIELELECLDVPCEATETCRGGNCISAERALDAANATPNATGPDEIAFQLPGSAPFLIAVASPGLPLLIDPVVINGLSQPGVVLDGTSAGAADGLVLSAGSAGSSILGLTVQNFQLAGVHCVSSNQHTIQGNRLGTDWSGLVAAGNGDGLVLTDCFAVTIGGNALNDSEFNVLSGNQRVGLLMEGAGSTGNLVRGNLMGLGGDGWTGVPNLHGMHLRAGASGNLIGGAMSVRNTVSANQRNGIRIEDAGTDGNVIQANLVGVDRNNSASTLLGNGWVGIRITQGPSGNLIGGDDVSVGNVVRNNDGGVGIDTLGPKDNAVIGNSISSNWGLGIDLGTDNAVTPNDPGDTDSGANDMLNFPDVSSVVYSGGQATVSFDLDVPAGDYRVEFFANLAPHASLYGEGEAFRFSTAVTHAGAGTQAYQATFSCAQAAWLTLTTTELLGSYQYGSTSEFSLAVPTTYTR